MSDELLHAMCEAYFSASGPSDIPFGLEMSAMRAVLDVLHAHGYRRCAEGQKVTQYCSAWEQSDKACRDLTEKVIPNIRERAEQAEAEVERLRNGRSILLAEIEMLRERIGNIIDPNDYGKGIWTRND